MISRKCQKLRIAQLVLCPRIVVYLVVGWLDQMKEGGDDDEDGLNF